MTHPITQRLPHASAACRNLNPHVFGEEPTSQPIATPAPVTCPKATEADFQRLCEEWLHTIGFRRRTPREIQRHDAGLWFIHVHKARRNPILLDLLLIDSTRGPYRCHCMEIELKVDGGKLSPEQRCLTARNEGVICWDFDQFQAAVGLWRKSVRERNMND